MSFFSVSAPEMRQLALVELLGFPSDITEQC